MLRPDPTCFPRLQRDHDLKSRMRQIRTSGSMSGTWKRSRVELLRHRQTKGPATDRLHLNHRATSRLYTLPLCTRFWDLVL